MKFFKWIKNKWTRIIVLGITLIGTILAISLGSFYYTGKDPKTSIDYGGGASVTVQILDSNNKPANEEKTKLVFDNIIKRVDPLGINGVAQSSSIGKDGYITITKAAIQTTEEKELFEKMITTKPVLSLYNLEDKSLFKNGNFIEGGVTVFDGLNNKTVGTDDQYRVPFKEDAAKATMQNGSYVVAIELKNDKAAREWGKATEWMSKQKNKSMVVWIDHQKLMDKMISQKSNNGVLWQKFYAARGNLLGAVTIPNANGAMWNKLFDQEGLPPASSYAVSIAQVTKPLYGNSFVIQGSFNQETATKLAERINYGSSNYKIISKSSHFLTAEYGKSAFQKALLAGVIVFALIAIFMIVNYGLLGALSTISIALYMFLTLTMFTVMRGEYSPETIAALVIGIGMSVDANIITFERLKGEVYSGSSIRKAHKASNKLSLSTIFDANITTLIVGFVLFYFGTASVKGFSIMLILSIVFTLLVMLIFTRVIASLMVGLNIFEKRKWLMGVNAKKIQTPPSPRMQKMMKIDFVKNAKWFSIGSGVIITIAIIVFAATAGIAGSLSGGMNSSIEFSGGTVMSISGDSKHSLNTKEANLIKEAFVDSKLISTDEANIVYKDAAQKEAILEIKTKKGSVDDQVWKNAFDKYFQNKPTKLNSSNYLFQGQSITSDVARALVRDAMIAISIAMIAIVIYTLVRFKWTYSISAILALVHDGLIVTAVFVITRVEVSPVFIAGLLSVLGYSINDTIVTFDRIREKMNKNVGDLSKAKLKKMANEAIKDTIKRSLLTSITTMVAIIVLMSFGNATKMAFNVAMLSGLISGTYSSIFIATYAWVHLEARSQKRSQIRREKQFWKLKENEEQTVEGINNFKA
ncbi:protein translocase subunit SecDF [Mycoplasma marinum]|uniref:Protein translocase subunit SecF n=1 Tax=Mycoplasma marinum TaxID=1937190 RepID=A0A4R0XQ87_9MOLU|nr:protein translocase subunit SecDF [Mycoplasma marinum]TCG11735.1 protein translocase subunit SecDF [Mycoplasma marinum]